MNPRTAAEIAASVTPTNYQYPEGDIRRYGAVVDGSTDDRAAWVIADSVNIPLVVAGNNDSVIATSLTITNKVIVAEGSKISASSGATVTFSDEVIYPSVSQIFAGAGSFVFTKPQVVYPDWWGAPSTARASPNSIIQSAITATTRGSTILFVGQYVTTPLDMVFDEGNQATATNRDAGKSLIGVSKPYAHRFGTGQTGNLGAEIILGNSQNDDLLTFTGVEQSGQPSRAHVHISGIALNGNKANQTSGRGWFCEWVKDVYGDILIKECKGNGFEFDATNFGNQFEFDYFGVVDCDGDGFRQGGLGDSHIDSLVVGGNKGDNAILISGMQCDKIHSYVAGSNGVSITGWVYVGSIRVNDCNSANVLKRLNGCPFDAARRVYRGNLQREFRFDRVWWRCRYARSVCQWV
jgi:hypothetical protein